MWWRGTGRVARVGWVGEGSIGGERWLVWGGGCRNEAGGGWVGGLKEGVGRGVEGVGGRLEGRVREGGA